MQSPQSIGGKRMGPAGPGRFTGLLVCMLMTGMGLSIGSGRAQAEDEIEPPADRLVDAGNDSSAAAPLHAAIRANDAGTTAQLIQTGADVQTPDGLGYTPLAAAVKQYRLLRADRTPAQESNRKILDLLLKAGANPRVRMPGREEPLLLYVRRSRQETELFQAMLEHGADPNVRFADKPLLHFFLFQHNLAFARLLIAHGADVNATYDRGVVVGDYRQCTALHYCALMQVRLDEVVPQLDPSTELLLDSGANPNLQDALGNTPLHYSAWFGRSDMVKALLAKGADPSIRNQEGALPLTRAHFEDVVALLAPVTPNATAQDIEMALDLDCKSAAIGLHQVTARVSSPLALLMCLAGLGLTGWWVVWRRKRLPPAALATGERVEHNGRRRRPRRKSERHGPEDNLEPEALARKQADLAAVRLARLRAQFLRVRLWAAMPLMLWLAAWVAFFCDAYLRALGLTQNLAMLAIGMLLCGLTANLFTRTEKGRLLVAALAMPAALGAAGVGLYWAWLFYHFQDLWLALVFVLAAGGAVVLAGIFARSFNTHFVVWRAAQQAPAPKLTAADEWEVQAGWDKAEA